jgi:lysozyme
MNEDKNLTVAGVKLIQHFESCLHPHEGKYRAYRCPANCLTIGWGHTNHHGRQFNEHARWTAEECDEAFVEDMAGFERDVRAAVTVPLTDYQFSALVSFTYNVGISNLKKSTLLKLVNQGKFNAVALEFKKWNKANGKVMKGLTRRRNSEAIMFEGKEDQDFDGFADDPMPQAVDAPEQRS